MTNLVVYVGLSLMVFFCLLSGIQGQQQTSYLDRSLGQPFRMIRHFLANLTATQKEINNIYRINKKMGKIQPHIPETQKFFCDTKNAPIKRSPTPPQSVNEVRPGDIDIIGVVGDSLAAANGAISTGLHSLFNENRGLSFSGGGRGDWRKYLTLPNILREFNGNLYGYSTEDGLNVDRSSKFNVAEPITMFVDMLFQTKLLFKRMQRDPKVNMTSHWKLITIFLGNNDICSKICELPNPESLIEEHERNIYDTLRFIRDNIPKTMVNWLIMPNLVTITKFKNVPFQCYLAERVECRCLYSSRLTPKALRLYEKIILEMQKVQREVISRPEFHTDTFTVNIQTFTQRSSLPTLPNGDTDLRYFASDCFHFSQLGQAAAAYALWNNMMEPEGTKSTDWMPAFDHFECPTNERPFIATRENSK